MTAERAAWPAIAGQSVKVKCKVAGLLPEEPTQLAIHDQGPYWGKQPAWHIERARVNGTRQIPVELIVNGHAVDKDTSRGRRTT